MKNPRRTLIVNLVLAVLLTGLLIGAMFVEDLNDLTFEFNGLFIGGLSFGFSGDSGCLTSDDSYDRGSEGEVAASDVQSLDICWTAGKVEIIQTDSDTVRFSEESGKDLKENQIMRWKCEDGVLRIRFGTKGGWFRNDPDKTLTIELPAEWSADDMALQTVSASLSLPSVRANDFRFDTVSGTVTAESIAANAVTLNGVSGGVRMDKVECGKLSVDSVSGEIAFDQATVTGKLSASTVSGAIRFAGSAGSVEWDTTSGNAELTFDRAPSSVEIDSTSGDASVTLPADVSGFSAAFDSVSGELTCEFAAEKKSGTLRYGDGSLEIEMDSTSGGLKIRKAS